jgi:glycosyltransferase involved in cell wall biosynthesis
MKELLDDPAKARQLSRAAQKYAQERFSIDRFARDWDRVFAQA